MTKLEELKKAIEAFCAREYRTNKGRFTGDNFSLFAVDCGGYDITSEVQLDVRGDQITLTVNDGTTRKQFTLRVED